MYGSLVFDNTSSRYRWANKYSILMIVEFLVPVFRPFMIVRPVERSFSIQSMKKKEKAEDGMAVAVDLEVLR